MSAATTLLRPRTLVCAVGVALLASARFRSLLRLLLLAVTLGAIVWAALTLAAVRLVAQHRAGRAAIRLPRPLAHAATPAAWQATLARYSWQATQPPTKAPLHAQLSPSANAAVDGLLELILREFVHDWLDRITGPGAPPSFPNAIEALVRHALSEVIVRAERVDWTAFAVSQLVPRITEHLDRFKAAEMSVRGGGTGKASAALGSVDDMLLASAFARDGRGGLHSAVDVAAVDSKPAEEAYLRAIMARILPLVLPPNEAGSGAVVAMAREIVACTIAMPLIQMITGALALIVRADSADPDFLNKLVDEKLRSFE